MFDNRGDWSTAALDPGDCYSPAWEGGKRKRRPKTGRAKELFNDWRGGDRGCRKFVPVMGGDGTKMSPPGDIFDQPSVEK